LKENALTYSPGRRSSRRFGTRPLKMARMPGRIGHSRLQQAMGRGGFLHTMSNDVLVGGDNSKMSMLEKLARLALEN
jgi:hypothetical protein